MFKTARTLALMFIGLTSLVGSAQKKIDSLDIKIGQMIMIGIQSRTAVAMEDALLQDIKNGYAGGIILFEKNIAKENSAEELKKMIGMFKAAAPLPLLVSIDEEGGKVHRLKEKYGFIGMPSAQYLGKLDNVDSTYAYNYALAKELKELGINFNYAPCLDVAVNPLNTVIVKRERSYSSDPDMVAKHALVAIKAHHDVGIHTIVKHFPGHGSSTADSHKGIVNVDSTWSFSELYPYNKVIESGTCDAVMTAHIINKHWDESMLPATLSKTVVHDVLRGFLKFNGVVFSDDMQMYAISKNYGVKSALEKSINAGVDIVLYGNNVDPKDKPLTPQELHAMIKKLVKKKKISRTRIDEAYKRILHLKLQYQN